MDESKSKPKGGGCYLSFAIFAILGIILIRIFLPFEAIPFVFEEFLFFKGEIWEPFAAAWILFAVGFILNFIKMATTTNPPEIHANASSIPVKGFATSVIAGVFEEITFRWILLYGFMGVIWIINLLIFQFTGQEHLKAVSELLFSSFTNFMVGSAKDILTHPAAWTIGAAAGTWTLGMAILGSNWKFQQGHLYLGISGMIFAWIGGMFFFRITFTHGLFAAILVHFAFDFMIFIMLTADVFLEKALGLDGAKRRMYRWYNER